MVHFKPAKLIFRSYPKVVLKAKSLELLAICLNSECMSEAFNHVYCFQPLKRNKNYLSLMKLILQAVSQYVSVARHSAVLNCWWLYCLLFFHSPPSPPCNASINLFLTTILKNHGRASFHQLVWYFHSYMRFISFIFALKLFFIECAKGSQYIKKRIKAQS